MSESLFRSSKLARQYLTGLADEIVQLPSDIDEGDFLGMEVCHDFRVQLALEVINSAAEKVEGGDSQSLGIVMAIISSYLGAMDRNLTLALSRQAVNESDEDAWLARMKSIAMTEKVNKNIREKWQIDFVSSAVPFAVTV